MAFTFDQIRCFVAVAEELHFGRAAESLQMTQPPLSRQIQKLERAVGVQLLERDNRKVELTAAGQAFLVEARRLLVLAGSSLRAGPAHSGRRGRDRSSRVHGGLDVRGADDHPERDLGVLSRHPPRPFRDGDPRADQEPAERRDRPGTGAAALRPRLLLRRGWSTARSYCWPSPKVIGSPSWTDRYIPASCRPSR